MKNAPSIPPAVQRNMQRPRDPHGILGRFPNDPLVLLPNSTAAAIHTGAASDITAATAAAQVLNGPNTVSNPVSKDQPFLTTIKSTRVTAASPATAAAANLRSSSRDENNPPAVNITATGAGPHSVSFGKTAGDRAACDANIVSETTVGGERRWYSAATAGHHGNIEREGREHNATVRVCEGGGRQQWRTHTYGSRWLSTRAAMCPTYE
eukprot:GDKI01006896.1.p1 GENE.GDKI01006896.1~~GDKI01006896.1.p1  ORF type:complete len:221 (-),score=41.59 GDKI01006896.1:244-870(-)